MSRPEESAARGTPLSPAKRALVELWKKRQFSGTAQVLSIPRRPSDGPAPLSFVQQRLWFLNQLEPGNIAYNLPYAMRLAGPLDVDALRRSFDAIMRRHEILRTTVALVEGQPVQVIAAEQLMGLWLLDLRGLPAGEREAALLRYAAEDARRPFDLAAGPLIRAALIRAGADDHALLLTMHHMVSDGWSLGVLIRELVTLYGAYAARRPTALPELPIQYADFAVWQRAWLQGDKETRRQGDKEQEASDPPSPILARPLRYACPPSPIQAQLAYWKRQLAGLAALALPTDHPRPAILTSRGAKRALLLPYELSTALAALGQSEGGTLFMAVLAVFKALLYRYAGQDDIVVGSPIAGRTRAEVELLIGCFVNTLVLRTDLSGNPTFRELLRRVREVVLGAYNHQDLPFEMLVEELQPRRDLSHNPLFQVMFVLQNAPEPALDLPGLTFGPLGVGMVSAQFDLTLSADETPHGLACVIDYNTDLFDDATITRMLDHLQVLIAGIAAAPERPITALPLLTDAERRRLLIEWQTTPAPPPDQCLHERFEAHATRSPDAVAVVFDRPPTTDHRPPTNDHRLPTTDHPSPLHPFTPSPLHPFSQHLTYNELNEHANRLAHHLASLGVGPDVIVGLHAERTPALLVGMLGILKAGGAYLPLDPSYPPERVAFMLEDSQAAVLITTNDQRPPTNDQRLPPHPITPSPCHLVTLSQTWPTIALYPPEAPSGALDPANLAYVIYTSGSTGTPKGVMISHANAVSLFAATQERFDFDARDVWTLFHSPAFDFSVWEIWGALGYGGKLVLVPYWVSRSPEALYGMLRAERVSVLNQTPSAFRQLMQADAPDDSAPDLALRLVIFGGEALDLASLRPWIARHGDRRPQLVNMYGITETTVHVTYRALTQADIDEPAGSRIGRPIATLRAYLLDRELQPVPIGIVGELYIGGAGVARGYLGRPDLTAERFIPNPFVGVTGDGCWVLEDSAPVTQHPSPNTRLYKTGDLARYRPTGDLEYFGRSDAQVKVRGFRIELGEIEAALAQHPGVREVAVIAREDAPGDKRLVAYIVPKLEDRGLKIEDSQADAPERLSSIFYPLSSDLRGFLTKQLPDYMLPAAFVALDGLPRTPSGKLDRRALPAPDQTRPTLAQEFVAPRSPQERILAEIWAGVLGLERVGVHDNFFDLGGDSMRSIQVLAQARERGLSFSLQQLFQHQTIAELALALGPLEPPAEPVTPAQPFSLLSERDRARLQALREPTTRDDKGGK